MNYSYRKLNVYAYARGLVLETYKLIDKFPQKEMYALGDQLRRAIVSVPSNIAEGLSRSSDKEKGHFLDIAYGSLMEAHVSWIYRWIWDILARLSSIIYLRR